jgi:hypothetical protein
LYDPSFLGAYGRLRQQETLAAADRRAARLRAKPAPAGQPEQPAERRRRWYSPMSRRSAARGRRDPFGSELQLGIGMSISVGCAREEDDGRPAAVTEPARVKAAEIFFEAGPASDRDVVEFLRRLASGGSPPSLRGDPPESRPSGQLRHAWTCHCNAPPTPSP